MKSAMKNMEEFYDEEIAPELLEIADRCKEVGMPFLAVVQFKDGDHGRTQFVPDGAHAVMKALQILAQCQEENGINLDKFVLSLKRGGFANESSMCAAIMIQKKA